MSCARKVTYTRRVWTVSWTLFIENINWKKTTKKTWVQEWTLYVEYLWTFSVGFWLINKIARPSSLQYYRLSKSSTFFLPERNSRCLWKFHVIILQFQPTSCFSVQDMIFPFAQRKWRLNHSGFMGDESEHSLVNEGRELCNKEGRWVWPKYDGILGSWRMLSSVKQKIEDQEAKYNFLIRQGENISDNLSMHRHLKNYFQMLLCTLVARDFK